MDAVDETNSGNLDGAAPRRRDLIVNAARVALAGACAVPMAALAQSSAPIKVGLVMSKQGPFAEQGTSSADGARIALEQAGGSVLDRKVELVWLDEPNPQSAQQNMMKVIQEEKAVAVIGGGNSATALAMSAVSRQQKVPLIIHAAAAREITGANCHRYAFRNQGTIPTYCRMLAPLAAKSGKRWYFLVGAFAFGADIYRSMQAELQAAGGVEAGADQVPLGTTDFSALILKIRQAKPDVLVLGIAGGDIVAFLRQFSEFGLRGKIAIVGPTISDNDLWAIEPAAVTGLYGKLWHFSDPRNGPDDAKLNTAVQALRKRPAGQNEYMGWIAMRMLLAGIAKGGSTEPAAIVRGLETARLSNGVHYREWDHQMMHRLVAVQGKDKISSAQDVVDVVASEPGRPDGMDALHGGRAEIGCKIGDL